MIKYYAANESYKLIYEFYYEIEYKWHCLLKCFRKQAEFILKSKIKKPIFILNEILVTVLN